jgi:hypothetical protein
MNVQIMFDALADARRRRFVGSPIKQGEPAPALRGVTRGAA